MSNTTTYTFGLETGASAEKRTEAYMKYVGVRSRAGKSMLAWFFYRAAREEAKPMYAPQSDKPI